MGSNSIANISLAADGPEVCVLFDLRVRGVAFFNGGWWRLVACNIAAVKV